ncbi:MAG: hypothetical protein ACOVOD_02440 [Rhodoferax sp.]|jgi:hypothetical protein
MLIKSADDKSKRLALLQDLQQSPMLEGAPLFLRERGYAPEVADHNSISLEPNWFHLCQSKSAIL